MPDAVLVGNIDVAELVFWAFVLFFIGLVFYLRREDRREGYPAEDELTGRLESPGGPLSVAPGKTFNLPFGRGTVSPPTGLREPVDIAARRTDRFVGAPYAPTGDPFVDGIGPAAWAERARFPDLDAEGRPRIVPLASDRAIYVAPKSPDPRGMVVTGADGRVAGTVTDLWIDRSDRVIRYLEIATPAGRQVLAPMAMSKVDGRRGRVHVDAIPAERFAGVPMPATPGQISRYEEERVQAYYGGGYLYGLPTRAEPLL
ncbi:MAG: photosynthetic reaction center subunit H [Sphingomonadaceae bacterium]